MIDWFSTAISDYGVLFLCLEMGACAPNSYAGGRLTSSKKRKKLKRHVLFRLSDRSSGEVDKSVPSAPDRLFSNPTFQGDLADKIRVPAVVAMIKKGLGKERVNCSIL